MCDIIQTEQVMFRNTCTYAYTHLYTHLHVITMKREAINVKGKKERYVGRFGVKKGKEEKDVIVI